MVMLKNMQQIPLKNSLHSRFVFTTSAKLSLFLEIPWKESTSLDRPKSLKFRNTKFLKYTKNTIVKILSISQWSERPKFARSCV